MAFKFEKLQIWQLALDMSCGIHDLTRTFPKEELFILTSQIKRAADSVSLNIAEGSTGQSNPEQKKFLGYAQRSAIEVVSCLYIGKRRSLLSEDQFSIHYNALDKLVAMIQKFKNSIK
ncbi:MAG: four helix bundle protein [Bacteroidota bacterium]|nr:four helix bundle protein [Bacteroidota bacterium]